jgi:hypothetical protein
MALADQSNRWLLIGDIREKATYKLRRVGQPRLPWLKEGPEAEPHSLCSSTDQPAGRGDPVQVRSPERLVQLGVIRVWRGAKEDGQGGCGGCESVLGYRCLPPRHNRTTVEGKLVDLRACAKA